MEKLRYGMVGGGPGSFIGDARTKAINIGDARFGCRLAFPAARINS